MGWSDCQAKGYPEELQLQFSYGRKNIQNQFRRFKC